MNSNEGKHSKIDRALGSGIKQLGVEETGALKIFKSKAIKKISQTYHDAKWLTLALSYHLLSARVFNLSIISF